MINTFADQYPDKTNLSPNTIKSIGQNFNNTEVESILI